MTPFERLLAIGRANAAAGVVSPPMAAGRPAPPVEQAGIDRRLAREAALAYVVYAGYEHSHGREPIPFVLYAPK